METIMEKEPTLIEQKFEDAVKNFRKEMDRPGQPSAPA